MSFWNGLRNGVKAVSRPRASGRYVAGGVDVVCPHCKSDQFTQGRALLNTAGMTMLGLDWANKEATTLTCDHCTMILWFGAAPISRE